MQPRPRALHSNASSAADATPQPAAQAEGRRGGRQRQGPGHAGHGSLLFHGQGSDLSERITAVAIRGNRYGDVRLSDKLVNERIQPQACGVCLDRLKQILRICCGDSINNLDIRKIVIKQLYWLITCVLLAVLMPEPPSASRCAPTPRACRRPKRCFWDLSAACRRR
jgi:hypothetical protein